MTSKCSKCDVKIQSTDDWNIEKLGPFCQTCHPWKEEIIDFGSSHDTECCQICHIPDKAPFEYCDPCRKTLPKEEEEDEFDSDLDEFPLSMPVLTREISHI